MPTLLNNSRTRSLRSDFDILVCRSRGNATFCSTVSES